MVETNALASVSPLTPFCGANQQRLQLELKTRKLPQDTQHLLQQIRLKLAEAMPNSQPLDFTVAICTYNGETRLPAVLECLLWQLNIQHLAWEVIVVDNNSSDGTAQVVNAFQQKWPRHLPLRYAFEPQQGASFARQHAIEIARSPLVGFLDDDNNPSLTWVAAAYRFGHQHPQAGAYGSRIRGDFEINTPPHFERIASLLALTERGPDPLLYNPQQKVLPPGAGLVVRRQAWLQHVPSTLALSTKFGERQAGEDLEVVLHLQNHGWEIWYNPAMRLYHRIPVTRLKRDYLIKLCRGIGLSRHRTRMLSFRRWQQPLVTPFYALNDLRKILRHLITYPRANFTETVPACELTLYLYSLISPLYLGGQGVQQWLRSSPIAPKSSAQDVQIGASQKGLV